MDRSRRSDRDRGLQGGGQGILSDGRVLTCLVGWRASPAVALTRLVRHLLEVESLSELSRMHWEGTWQQAQGTVES